MHDASSCAYIYDFEMCIRVMVDRKRYGEN